MLCYSFVTRCHLTHQKSSIKNARTDERSYLFIYLLREVKKTNNYIVRSDFITRGKKGTKAKIIHKQNTTKQRRIITSRDRLLDIILFIF